MNVIAWFDPEAAPETRRSPAVSLANWRGAQAITRLNAAL
jgi:hypothetical protein